VDANSHIKNKLKLLVSTIVDANALIKKKIKIKINSIRGLLASTFCGHL
jgi:hypothetical protein